MLSSESASVQSCSGPAFCSQPLATLPEEPSTARFTDSLAAAWAQAVKVRPDAAQWQL